MKSRCEIQPLTAATLREAIDSLPEPMLLLDSELRLDHLNTAAEPLFAESQRWASLWRDPTGSDGATCLAPVLLGRPCSRPGLCEGCHLHQTLAACLARGESAPPLRVDRTTLKAGRVRTVAFEVLARAIEIQGAAGFLVTLRAAHAAQGDRGQHRLREHERDALRRPA